MNLCNDPSGCPNEGIWRTVDTRYGPMRRKLCAKHAARWHRRTQDHPSSDALESSFKAHPANYEPEEFGHSLKLVLSHPFECTCKACAYFWAHTDDGVDNAI